MTPFLEIIMLMALDGDEIGKRWLVGDATQFVGVYIFIFIFIFWSDRHQHQLKYMEKLVPVEMADE